MQKCWNNGDKIDRTKSNTVNVTAPAYVSDVAMLKGNYITIRLIPFDRTDYNNASKAVSEP